MCIYPKIMSYGEKNAEATCSFCCEVDQESMHIDPNTWLIDMYTPNSKLISVRQGPWLIAWTQGSGFEPHLS